MSLIIDAKSINPYNNYNLRKIIYHKYLPMLIDILEPMGAQSDCLRSEVCQNLILSPMNTDLLRHAVATVLTVYGIETHQSILLQQEQHQVATVLTVYGIETLRNRILRVSL